MLVAIEDVVNEAVDDGRLTDGLISQKDDFVFEKRRNCSFGEIQIADIGCHLKIIKRKRPLSLRKHLQIIKNVHFGQPKPVSQYYKTKVKKILLN